MIPKAKNNFTSYLALVLMTSVFCISAIGQNNLNTQNWIHGSDDCKKNTDELIQVLQYH